MNSDCGSEVYVFPGAGSFGSDLRSISGTLVRYPGRFGKDLGTPAGSFAEVVRSAADQVRAERPVLVGHSYGAYVAYATAALLGNVARLVVIGATAPALHTVAPESISDTEAYLERVSPGLVQGEWRDIVVETAAQDMKLLSEFSDYPMVNCSIVAMHGEADPLTPAEGAARWADVTTGPFSHHVLAGGHSDLLTSQEMCRRIQ